MFDVCWEGEEMGWWDWVVLRGSEGIKFRLGRMGRLGMRDGLYIVLGYGVKLDRIGQGNCILEELNQESFN